MFRRLIAFVRACGAALRAAAAGARHWLADWLYILTTPIRAFHPARWLRGIADGVMELLATARLIRPRPRQLSSGLATGGREVVGLGRNAFDFVVWTWYFLRTRTRRQLVYIAAAATVVLAGAGGVPAYVLWEHRRSNRISFLQRNLEGYLAYTDDVDKLEATLAALAKEMPANETVARELAYVRAREAPPTESKLVRFFMRYHWAKGRVAEATREADKIIQFASNDWEAHCYLALAALSRGDRAGAKRQISNLPPVAEAANTLPANVTPVAARLFATLGDDARYDDVIDLITTHVLPPLKSRSTAFASIPDKLFLVDCYHLALTRLEKRQWLTTYWAAAEEALQSVADDRAVDVPTLIRVGLLRDNDYRVLKRFLQLKLVPAEDANVQATDLMHKQFALWEEVIRRDRRNSWGYLGLCQEQFEVGAREAAVETVLRGLDACGERPELVLAVADHLRFTDPPRGLAFLDRVVRDEMLTPTLALIYEQTAAQANRPDRAIEVCRRMLAKDPNQDWARLREAASWLELSRPADAAEVLRPIEGALPKYPDGCANYVRALSESGAKDRLDAFLNALAAGRSPPAVLLKTAEGLQAAGRYADAVHWAERVLEDDRSNVRALMLVADNTRRLADKGAAGWDVEMVNAAIRAYRAVERLEPEEPVADRVANNVAWLELKALRLPQEAFKSAARLRAAEAQIDIKAEYLETIGAVYLGVGEYRQAVRALERAVDVGGRRASFLTHLALAYHGEGRADRAEQCLQAAVGLANTPHDQADVRDASRTIHGR
jgi:tetratricopeptide (TPR) repeat protein